MPQLVLVRHGNTFETGTPLRMAGGKTDMKLTAAGEEQGHAVAKMIANRFMPVNGILTAPLERTRRFAEMIGKATNNVFTIDERLCEICYGLWENKTSDEIRSLYGSDILEQWEKSGAWPENMQWAPSKPKLIRNIGDFLSTQHKKLESPNSGNRIVITSNGILRFVYHIVTGKDPDATAKVKTGNYCVLSPTTDGWTIEAWDMKP